MVFLSLQINGSYTAHKSVFINIYNDNVLFWFMTISSLHRCENVNHVPSITYVPNHAYLSLVLMIGSGSGAKCHACINTNTYMDIYIYIFVCVCVLWCFTFRFQAQLRLSSWCCHCSSIVIPSSSLGTAAVWKLLKIHPSITDFWVTPLPLGPQPS